MPPPQLALAALAGFAVAAFVFTRIMARRINAATPPRGKFAVLGKGRMHYTEILPDGVARGVVVLIHGASGNESDLMLPLGESLAARRFRVVAVDRPGHGWSDRMGAESHAEQAAAVVEALASIRATPAIVVGHSLGGACACAIAIEHASATAGLVLLAPVTHPWPGGIALRYHVAATPFVGALFANLLAMPVGLAVIDRALAAVFAPRETPDGYRARTGLDRALRPATFAANSRDVLGTFAFVSRQAPRLRQIAAPTAIVTGDSDAVVYAHIHSRGSARDIPGATLAVLPGVGHSPHWAGPEAVVAAIEEVARRGG